MLGVSRTIYVNVETPNIGFTYFNFLGGYQLKTSQELRMLSSVTINCQITKIVMNSGSQLSEL